MQIICLLQKVISILATGCLECFLTLFSENKRVTILRNFHMPSAMVVILQFGCNIRFVQAWYCAGSQTDGDNQVVNP